MRAIFKIRQALAQAIQEDLARNHEFAHERVGFIACRAAQIQDGIMVLAETYQPVADDNYLEDESVGALISGSAIRAAMQISLDSGAGMFHVHMHEHIGVPRPSRVDLEDSKKFVPDFFNVAPFMPHGTVILSKDKAFGLCWLGKEHKPIHFDMVMISGAPIRLVDIRI
jgi:hypothetical protein